MVHKKHNFLKAHNTFYPLTPHPSPVHRPTRPIPHIRSCSHLGRNAVGQSPAEYSSSEKCLLKMVTSGGVLGEEAPTTLKHGPERQKTVLAKGPWLANVLEGLLTRLAQWAVPILFLCTVPKIWFSPFKSFTHIIENAQSAITLESVTSKRSHTSFHELAH